MKFTAFILGLTAFGLASGDVSHLLKNQQGGHHNSLNGQQQVVVKQAYASNNNNAFTGNNQNSKRYWWMNTETLPFNQNSRTQVDKLAYASQPVECTKCASSSVQLKRHNTQNSNPYSHNPFMRGKYITRSPSEVNNYFSNNFQSSRIQQAPSCTDSNSACVAPRFCFNGIIDQSYENQVPRSAPRRCNGQEVCCRFAQRRNANFKVFSLDSEAQPAQSTSEVLTNEGYVVKKPNNQYLPVPQQPSYDPAPNNDDPVFVPAPTTRRPSPPPPTPPRPTQPRTTFAPAPPMIPVGCSAAMNCTRLEMCTAMGVISKTPVILTPEQQIFRVPLTECLHPQTKEQGFCCRDPDYVDPWPVGQTGQYVPEELNKVFDSGAYNPGETRVDPVSVKPDGYIIPQPSNTQNRLYLPPNNRI